MKASILNRRVAAAVLGLSALVAASASHARTDVYLSVGVPVPAPVYVPPPQVVVQPAPMYAPPQPVYVPPQPVYVVPAPVYARPGYDDWRWRREEWRREQWRREQWRRWHHHHDRYDD